MKDDFPCGRVAGIQKDGSDKGFVGVGQNRRTGASAVLFLPLAEQEQVAEVMANRAKLVLAEAEVPKAMADAFRSGNLGILDYYRMKNIDADTRMRTQIAAGEEQQIREEADKDKVKD